VWPGLAPRHDLAGVRTELTLCGPRVALPAVLAAFQLPGPRDVLCELQPQRAQQGGGLQTLGAAGLHPGARIGTICE
jgi:hypothetical protein